MLTQDYIDILQPQIRKNTLPPRPVPGRFHTYVHFPTSAKLTNTWCWAESEFLFSEPITKKLNNFVTRPSPTHDSNLKKSGNYW